MPMLKIYETCYVLSNFSIYGFLPLLRLLRLTLIGIQFPNNPKRSSNVLPCSSISVPTLQFISDFHQISHGKKLSKSDFPWKKSHPLKVYGGILPPLHVLPRRLHLLCAAATGSTGSTGSAAESHGRAGRRGAGAHRCLGWIGECCLGPMCQITSLCKYL